MFHASRTLTPRLRSSWYPPAPLFPEVAAQLATYPLVDFAQRAQHFGNAEIRFPAKQAFSQLRHDHFYAVASYTTGQFQHLDITADLIKRYCRCGTDLQPIYALLPAGTLG